MMANYRHQRVRSAKGCDPRSYRTVVVGKHRVIVCCPRGAWDPAHQICRVGTVATSVLHPRQERP